jgi:hypothetical protein
MYSKMLIRGAASPDELREAFRESDKGIGAAQQSIDRRNRLSREWFDAGKWSEAK